MLYSIVKVFVRLALKIFCRRITISDTDPLRRKGPLLLACSHPNSFLDAIILGSQFEQPVHFLARGDAFRKPFISKLLTALKLIPIYRLSEGREYLALNDATFDRCRQILLQGGIVLIFSEGLCLNQWALQPLKKGSARIALDAWTQPSIEQVFQVLPVSLNYNGFSNLGKRLIIHFGQPINREDVAQTTTEGDAIQSFNSLLTNKLSQGMLIADGDQEVVQFLVANATSKTSDGSNMIEVLQRKQQYARSHGILPAVKRTKMDRLVADSSTSLWVNVICLILFAIPAALSWLAHAPLYLPLKNFIKRKTAGTVFYDSILLGALLLLYPVYWTFINVIVFAFMDHWYIKIPFLTMPLLAWLYLVWKDCLQVCLNYFALNAQQRGQIKAMFD